MEAFSNSFKDAGVRASDSSVLNLFDELVIHFGLGYVEQHGHIVLGDVLLEQEKRQGADISSFLDYLAQEVAPKAEALGCWP